MKTINRLLIGAGSISALSFLGFSVFLVRHLVCSQTCPYYLILSAIVLVGAFIVLLVLLWIVKEIHTEEIKRDMRILELIKQDKKDSSNEELFNKFEALKSAISEIDSTIKKIEKRNNS